MPEEYAQHKMTSAAQNGWGDAGAFFGSIMSGLLLGFFADWIFGTDPLFIVIGIIAGSASGFFAMYRHALAIEVPPSRTLLPETQKDDGR